MCNLKFRAFGGMVLFRYRSATIIKPNKDPIMNNPERNFGSERESQEDQGQQEQGGSRVDRLFEGEQEKVDIKEKFKEMFPIKFEQLNKLADPRLSDEEFLLGVEEFNEHTADPKENLNHRFEFSFNPNRKLIVRFDYTGRVRVHGSTYGKPEELEEDFRENNSVLQRKEGPTVSQLAWKYNLTKGNQVAFRKEEIKPGKESTVGEGTVQGGKLETTVEKGDPITFSDRDTVISSVQDIYEKEGKVFIETETSRYVLGSV